MAYPVNFKGTNFTYRAPQGRDDISDLHVFKNRICNVSCWELTPEELEEINRTGKVFLSSMSGDALFPAFVGSEKVVRSVVVDYGAIW